MIVESGTGIRFNVQRAGTEFMAWEFEDEYQGIGESAYEALGDVLEYLGHIRITPAQDQYGNLLVWALGHEMSMGSGSSKVWVSKGGQRANGKTMTSAVVKLLFQIGELTEL